MIDIVQLLTESVSQRASDLHLSAGVVPMIRVDGELKKLDHYALHHDDIIEVLNSIMSEAQLAHFAHAMECDFSFEIAGLSRFRVNAYQQTRGVAVAFLNVFLLWKMCLRLLFLLNSPAVRVGW